MAAADGVRGVSALHDELKRAKDCLKNVDESIKKITGRDPTENRPFGRGGGPGPRRLSQTGPGQGGAPWAAAGGRLFNKARGGLASPDGPPQRRIGRGAFSRLGPVSPQVFASRLDRPPARRDSGDDDEIGEKPALPSSVVASPAEPRSRQQSLDEASTDKKGKQRNQRMFGLLMGTLQQFKREEKQKEDKEAKRKVIEEKLDQKAKDDKDRARQERQQLFEQRREKQLEMKRIEQKLERVQNHEDWEKQTRLLMNFIRTSSEPHIFYRPKSLNTKAKKKLDITQNLLEDIIQERRRQLEDEIEELTKKAEAIGGEEEEEEEEDGQEAETEDMEDHGNGREDVDERRIELVGDETNGERTKKSESEDKENLELGVNDVNIEIMGEEEIRTEERMSEKEINVDSTIKYQSDKNDEGVEIEIEKPSQKKAVETSAVDLNEAEVERKSDAGEEIVQEEEFVTDEVGNTSKLSETVKEEQTSPIESEVSPEKSKDVENSVRNEEVENTNTSVKESDAKHNGRSTSGDNEKRKMARHNDEDDDNERAKKRRRDRSTSRGRRSEQKHSRNRSRSRRRRSRSKSKQRKSKRHGRSRD